LAPQLLLNDADQKWSDLKLATLHFMKKTDRKLHRQTMNLGDLIMTVSSCAKNNQETVATVVDLLNSGRVLMGPSGHASRVHVGR
jgi:hypothetical protein